ncbi:MAG: hypothetical protein IT529_22235 [Burkholderiales bacterium]|nr:hypothetical protein [Burkholderiales bacterium]
MTLRVLDPRLHPEGEALRPAPPLASLEGAVIGMIDNAKIGTERFYDHVAGILEREYGVREFIRRRKPDATRPVAPDMLAEMSAADAILSAIGD